MPAPPRIPNPDLAIGDDNKQRWNRPAHRRHGFHNAHRLFRRALMLRAHAPTVLGTDKPPALAQLPEVALLTARPEFSGLVCLRGDQILLSRHAPDFAPDQPHSIQSISKLLMHLVAGRLVAEGLLDPASPVEAYLPAIGSAYRGAPVQDVLDMNVTSDFSEDYDDPLADCFTEEVALGWRLPPEGTAEVTMHDFVCALTGPGPANSAPSIAYSSANTDLLTVICDRLCPGRLPHLLEEITDDAGFMGALHMSLSPEGLPAFAGGGCLTATDLARLGRLLGRVAAGEAGLRWNSAFAAHVPAHAAKTLPPPRDGVRYAHQMMTDGTWIGHAGYGGQFLLADPGSGVSCAYLSVLENASGYCEDYMAETIACLAALSRAAATA